MATYHDFFKIQSDRRPTFEDVTERVEKVLAVAVAGGAAAVGAGLLVGSGSRLASTITRSL